jgi:hypothetical protein
VVKEARASNQRLQVKIMFLNNTRQVLYGSVWAEESDDSSTPINTRSWVLIIHIQILLIWDRAVALMVSSGFPPWGFIPQI